MNEKNAFHGGFERMSKSGGERHEPNLLVFPLFLLVKCAMYCVSQWILVCSEKYLCTNMFSLAVCARCQLLVPRPKVRATVVPVGKDLDIHHQLCPARTIVWFGHGCSSHHMLLEHERYYDLGMNALVTVCSWNTNGVVMVCAWML